MVGYPGDICLGILGRNFLLTVRPHSICIFFPTVGFLQGDFLSSGKLRVHHNVPVIPGIIFRQGIGIGNIIFHFLQFFVCKFPSRSLCHVRGKIHTFVQLQNIHQVFLCVFLFLRCHLGKLRIRIVIVIFRRHLIRHAERNPAAVPCMPGHAKGSIVIVICLPFLRAVSVHHRKGIQVIEVIRIQCKLDSPKPFAILIFFQNRNSLPVINAVI